MVKTEVKQTRVLGKEWESGPDRIVGQDRDRVCNRIWSLGCFCVDSGWKQKPDTWVVVEKCVIGLYLLYTSQNLLGTIFRVTFAVLYRRIWSIVGNYSILCCNSNQKFKTQNQRRISLARWENKPNSTETAAGTSRSENNPNQWVDYSKFIRDGCTKLCNHLQ
jgi:hypothetical protein